MLTFRALLDFIQLTQYTAHDTNTLAYLEKALNTFQQNKAILVELSICDHLNIPRFHMLKHYTQSIHKLGATDNYNMEAFKHLHIGFAKAGWRASNHCNTLLQMVHWLEWCEKMVVLDSSIDCWLVHTGCEQQDGSEDADHTELSLSKSQNSCIKLTKHPSVPLQALPTITTKHQCPSFKESLAQYIYCLKNAHPLSSAQLPDTLANMPFNHLDVFHSDNTEDMDAVKATLVKGEQPAHFDTVVVMLGKDAEATSLQGEYIHHSPGAFIF